MYIGHYTRHVAEIVFFLATSSVQYWPKQKADKFLLSSAFFNTAYAIFLNRWIARYGGSPLRRRIFFFHHPRGLGRQFWQGGSAPHLAIRCQVVEKKIRTMHGKFLKFFWNLGCRGGTFYKNVEYRNVFCFVILNKWSFDRSLFRVWYEVSSVLFLKCQTSKIFLKI